MRAAPHRHQCPHRRLPHESVRAECTVCNMPDAAAHDNVRAATGCKDGSGGQENHDDGQESK